MVGWLNTTYAEISEANITNASGSTAGLVTGRRVKKAVEAFAPVKSVNGQTGDVVVTGGVSDVEVNGESVVDENGIAKVVVPPLVTDLGEIDPEEYDYDAFTFINTLIDSGWYFFFFDEFTYFVQVQSFGDDNNAYVNQHVWYNEENPVIEYIRGLHIEDGEIVDEMSDSYITYETAVSAFASKSHYHYRTASGLLSVWDYCNTGIVTNGSPILYTDTASHNQYLIDTWMTTRQPIYQLQKITDLNDGSSIYQRRGTYVAGNVTWDDWYKFSGTVFTP